MPVETIHHDSPLLLTLPYTGTSMTPVIAKRLRDPQQCFTVPDRYLDRLMSGLGHEMNVVRANFHRYLSDVDYAGASKDFRPTKGMMGGIPLLDATGESIWDEPPFSKELAVWWGLYHAPYHAAVAAQIARIRARKGHTVLLNCRARPESALHPIDAPPADITFSIGPGQTCDFMLSRKIGQLLKNSGETTVSISALPTTGYTTRTYGRPPKGVHAFDLDIDESCYLSTLGIDSHYDPDKAQQVRKVLTALIDYLTTWRPS